MIVGSAAEQLPLSFDQDRDGLADRSSSCVHAPEYAAAKEIRTSSDSECDWPSKRTYSDAPLQQSRHCQKDGSPVSHDPVEARPRDRVHPRQEPGGQREMLHDRVHHQIADVDKLDTLFYLMI
jgi:hypothetical protein